MYNIIVYTQPMRLGFMECMDRLRKGDKDGGGDEVYDFMFMLKKNF